MNLQVQVILGKSTQTTYQLTGDQPLYEIGRDDQAAIHLSGDRIAQQHAKLTLDNENRWQLNAEQGRVKHAGEFVESVHVADQQTVSIGPYLLKFTLINPMQDLHSEPEVDNSTKESLENKYPRIWVNRFKSTPSLKRMLNLKSLFKSNTDEPKDVVAKPLNKRRVLLILLVIVTWSIVVLKSCGSQPEIVESNSMADTEPTEVGAVTPAQQQAADATDQLSLDDKRIADRYIQWANQLYQQGELEQAFLRLQAGHQKIPAHGELKTAMEQLRGELIQTHQSSAQFDKAIALLEPIKNQSQQHFLLYEQLLIQQNESINISTQVASLRKKLDGLAAEYHGLLDLNKFEQARGLLNRIDKKVLDYDAELKQQYADWIQALSMRENNYRDELLKQQAEQQQALADSQHAFSLCLDYMHKDDFMSAYDACAEVKEINADNFDATEVELLLTYLDEKRYADTREFLAKAKKCYTEQNFVCAFENWHNVLQIDDEHTQATEQYNRALENQIKTAQRLYKTAKAYEDLGQIDQAKLELEELLWHLPLPDQPLYKKASELYESLKQY